MRFFDPENGLWQTVSQVADVLGLSTCWLICSIPLVTLGASTTALYDGVVHGVRRQESGVYARFFRTFRDSFKPATLVTLALFIPTELLLMLVFLARASLQGGSEVGGILFAAGLVLLCLPLAVWLMAMAALSRFTFESARNLGVTGLKLAMAHVPVSMGLAVVTALLFWWMFRLLPLSLPLLFFVPGLIALLASFPMERVLRRYEPPKAEENADSPEDD